MSSSGRHALHGARHFLAAAYLKTGERDKSVAEIRQWIAAHPEFKNLGEYYIEEIQAGRNP